MDTRSFALLLPRTLVISQAFRLSVGRPIELTTSFSGKDLTGLQVTTSQALAEALTPAITSAVATVTNRAVPGWHLHEHLILHQPLKPTAGVVLGGVDHTTSPLVVQDAAKAHSPQEVTGTAYRRLMADCKQSAATSTSNPSAQAPGTSSREAENKARMIAGITVGGIAALIVCTNICCFCCVPEEVREKILQEHEAAMKQAHAGGGCLGGFDGVDGSHHHDGNWGDCGDGGDCSGGGDSGGDGD